MLIAYASPHDIVYDTTKTVCMLVRPKRSKCRYSTRILLDNVPLSYVDDFKYLGHIISSDCKDDKDVCKQFRRQNAVGNMLIRKFSFAPTEAKIQLFKSHCYPIYGNSLWGNAFQYSLRKLTVSYNDTFKRLVGEPRWTSSSRVFAENYADHIKVIFRKSAFSLMRRIVTSSNTIIHTICNSDAHLQSGLLRKWEELLYVG